MSVRPVRKLPNNLPPARIYLDDIEEIAAIFTRITETCGSTYYREQTTTYKIDGSITCDTIEDLRHLRQKRSGDFELTSGVGYIRISRYDTTWDIRASDDALQQTTYAQLSTIFEQRKMRIKALVRSFPWWTGILLGYAVPGPVIALIRKLPVSNSGQVSVGALLLVGLVLAIYKLVFQHSVVEFRNAHESNTLSTRLEELKPYIVGAFIGGAFTALGQRFIKWLWP